VTFLDVLSKYLLIVEVRFDARWCSNTGKEKSDAGQIKFSCGPQVSPHLLYIISSIRQPVAQELDKIHLLYARKFCRPTSRVSV